jgi:hypothetical protein
MGGLSFSWEIAKTEVKGWITKIYFQRGRFMDMSFSIPSGYNLKGFSFFENAL